MKFTLSWLKDHLETDATVDAIAERLTMIGLEVEAVVDRAKGLDEVIVALVAECAPHPDADRLQVCVVDTGNGRVQVVCGAPNARAGLKGVFAPAFSHLPGLGGALKPATIRGVESRGMLLSERECGLSDAHDGIIELSPDAQVGAPAAPAMGLADPLFDVAITPNRSDCLSVRGLARDLAASGLGTLKPLDVAPAPAGFDSPVAVRLDLGEADDACPTFVGRVIRGLRNGPAPQWMQDRLTAIGLRPISALVDITNYMTVDLARPLHAFDASRVEGDLTVRLARPGERLAALNGRDLELTTSMTVIADDKGPEALGGVIGGEASACTEATTDVFLESALFDPVRTAMTGRTLNILSDARYRFERGIDPDFLVDGIEIATRLILASCGGEASRLVVAGSPPPTPPAIPFRPGRVAALAGVDVSAADSRVILDRLGFTIADQGDDRPWSVTVPSWRHDVVGEACLVEEVIRIRGLDRIPTVSLPRDGAVPPSPLTPAQRRPVLARRILAGRGLVEAVTMSFLSGDVAALFGGGEGLRLVNPISADLDVMRPSLLPNLLRAAGRNADMGLKDAALFEVGPCYAGTAPNQQTTVAGAIRSGRTGPRHWAQPPRPIDAYDAKADVFHLLDSLGVPVDKLTLTSDAPAWYHGGRSAQVRLGPKVVLAQFGEIHPAVLRRLDLRGPAVGFELIFDALPARKARVGHTRPALKASPLQPVERDFAFVVDADVPAAALIKAVRSTDPALITDVRVFDVFAGGGLPAGTKSLAVSVLLQPVERTLTDKDLDAIQSRIAGAVSKATGGTLRT